MFGIFFEAPLALLTRSCLIGSEILFIISVNLSVTSGDDFFDDEFNRDFEKMEKEDRFHNKLEDGFKNWEER